MSQQLIYRQLLEFPTQQPKDIPLWITTATLIVDIRGSLSAYEVLDAAYLIQYQFRDGLGWVKNQILKVSSNLSQVEFDGSYPYKLRVLPVKGVKQFELSVWVNSQYASTNLNLYSGENRLSLQLPDLIESYSLIYPATKPLVGQVQRIASPEGRTEWVFLIDETALSTKSPIGHHHPISEVDQLAGALDSLTAAIASKAATAHGHQVADITGLTASINNLATAISGKAPTVHGHDVGDVSGLQTSLDGKTEIGHTHSIANIGTLQDVLNGKANQADVTAALSQKADANHTHPTTAIAWDAPGAIGYTTPNSGKFTTLNITSSANTVSTTTGAFLCTGGAYIAKNVIVGGQLSVYDALRHTGASIGFLGASPITRPTVSGSRGGNAALLSALTALKNLGLIIDSTTA